MSSPDNAAEKVGSVLVVGGGIGGMQAALDLAESGYAVHLVTEETSIGGQMARLDKTFPTNDCAMCLLGPKMTDSLGHPNITIHTGASVEGLEGEAGHFRARVRLFPRYVSVQDCTACGECEPVCPVTVADPFNVGMGKRKAIGKLFPQATPNAYYIEKRGTPPCRAACPAGCNAQGYVNLLAAGKYREALGVVRRNIPLPGICGRVCFHPCEGACYRTDVDQPVAICALKRFLGDYERTLSPEEIPHPEPGERPAPAGEVLRVAVIGSGPAGLTAAYYLALAGYGVTVFEKREQAGGLLRYGIPAYRLPREILDYEIGVIQSLGVDIRTSVEVGKDLTLPDLRAQGYGAVIVCTGAGREQSLGVPGEDAPGVMSSMEFLGRVSAGEEVTVGPRVAVVGGGNAAVDAARTALRLGAQEVRILYRRSRAEMPASAWEVEEAEHEGVRLDLLCNPVQIRAGPEGVREIELVRMELGEPDETGRRRPVAVPGSNFRLPVDTVIVAIGQRPDEGFASEAEGLSFSTRGTLVVDATTCAGPEGVFAAGDLTLGPSSVVEAIASGRAAAESAMAYLRGEPLPEAPPRPEPVSWPERKDYAPQPRQRMPALSVAERHGGFREVEQGFDEETARREAARCLYCGTCCECLECAAVCQKKAIHHDDRGDVLEIPVGAVILAPGYDLHDPLLEGEYGYGVYPNVVTSMEFERLLSSTGPTRGEIARPSDGAHPRRIAFIQCVGSRDTACGAEYCSSICCMYATKEAIIAREHDPDVEATIFYLDIRSFGKGFDRYVNQAKNVYGVRYVRSLISAVKENPANGNLRIRYYARGALHEEEFDLVVLSLGVRPPAAASGLAEKLSFDLDEYGFAATGEFDPVSTSRPGVFAAGAFRGPQDIPETVMSASAAAAAPAALLAGSRGQLVKEKVYPPERDVDGEEPRVGVFVCRCGINIASVVNVPAVVEYAAALPGVVHAEEFVYTCSQDTLARIREIVAERGLNRVVVASCSIRTHQPLFRENMREAGLNQFLFEMANIRDQCSWVHRDDPVAATDKAKDLVAMAVAKVKRHRSLQLHPVEVVPKGLVIGGGIAGMTAALALAGQGYGVYLLEKEEELGGTLRRLRTTIAGADVRAYLEEVQRRVRAHPLIEVMTGARVEEVAGHAGHFRTTVSTGRAEGPRPTRQVEHGAIIVATGAVESRPEAFAYGSDPRVLTGLELEERLAGGEVPGDVDRVAFIQCVGSRDEARAYCSRTCCAQSVKNALAIKEKRPEAEVYVLYRDMRTYGHLERYYREARERGILFVPFADDQVPELTEEEGRLVLRVTDEASGLPLTISPDLVVLAAASISPPGTRELASLLKVPVTEDGFFLETHIKLGPMDFPSQGIFLCGSAHWPKFIGESVYQAQGAAARAATILSKSHLLVGGVVAVVDEERCAACLTCVRVCPYSVPVINERHVAEINPVQCQGCGTCAGECPARAIQLQHYSDDQVAAKLEDMFAGEGDQEAAASD